jgi:hypothetical protein
MVQRVSAKPLSRIVADDPTLADWQRRRIRDEALLQTLRPALPRALAAQLSIGDAETPELVIAGYSGAVAAVVRQRGPDLLGRLTREGWKFTGIRVVVQPRATTGGEKKLVTLHMDSAAIPALSALRDGLAPGALRDALARIVAKRR